MKHLFQHSNTLKVLEWFLKNPNDQISLRALSRTLKISASSISGILNLLHSDGLVSKNPHSNLIFFKSISCATFKALKIAHNLHVLEDCKILDLIEQNSSVLYGVYLYGSCAKGEDTASSDIDILVIASDCWVDFSQLSSRVGREVNLKIFSMPKWVEASKNNRAFYLEVISNCTSLKGEKPVID